MPNYVYPKFTKNIALFSNMNERQEFQDQVNHAENENERLYKEALVKHGEMLSVAKSVYGANSAQVKYLKRNKPERPLRQKGWNAAVLASRKYEAEAKRKTKAHEAKARHTERTKKAIAALEAAGYTVGDYWNSAITFAKEKGIEFDVDNSDQETADSA